MRSLSQEPAFGDHLARVDALLRQVLADATIGWQSDDLGADDQAVDDQAIDDQAIDDHGPTLGDLPELLGQVLFSGGKRLRPIVGLLGFQIAGGRPGTTAEQDLIRVCAALELLHSFALVQDDVMDSSVSRRGRPTAHVLLAARHRDHGAIGRPDQFGESLAVLLGDLAHAEADHLINSCAPEIARRWHRMIIELIRGQVGDLVGAAVGERRPRSALAVAQLKSGGYTIKRPLELGAATAGADQSTLRRLEVYGHEAGSAFALRDDILGVWGDPTVTGKPAGDDLIAGKPTVIIALAHQRLPLSERRLLDRAGSELTKDDVVRLQQVITICGVRAEVETMIQRHVDCATSAVAPLASGNGPRAGAANALIKLAGQVAWRDR
ncbi:polyprenyl synthetase family protein [Microlunatus endophyticus]|uniref:polyprenyl synthetase family protein n=1 Tax=Microlunatus endophyticus TaxID=1716077 RepID=UPI001663797E|nr:polyprenyl synthetase family protein [Microlunatus endophyticus]